MSRPFAAAALLLLLAPIGCGALFGVDFDAAERLADGADATTPGTDGSDSGSLPSPPVQADGGCPRDFVACGGRCVATNDPAYGCGAATCSPCAVPHATATCKPREGGEGFVCGVAACSDDWKDCNGSPFDGCEAPPPLDPGSCAACDVACLVRDADDGIVGAGRRASCGVRPDGTLRCWGAGSFGENVVPANLGPVRMVSAGLYHTCALRKDGTVACWGTNESGRSTPPGGTFTSLSMGGYHACALRSGGAIECWGDNSRGQGTFPPGPYRSVSAGESHTCAIKLDGAVVCVGSYGAPLETPPSGPFRQVSAGNGFTCGVRVDGTLVCWGSFSPTPTVTAGFRQVSSGSQHACAIKTDGFVQCWGSNGSGQGSPPPGAFRQISAGEQHACGELIDGKLVCWGNNDDGRVSPIPP